MHLSRHPTSYPTRYQEIAARLEQELRHHYRCGDYLPAEQQLATRFDVNRHTLRRAIDQLVERGLGPVAQFVFADASGVGFEDVDFHHVRVSFFRFGLGLCPPDTDQYITIL